MRRHEMAVSVGSSGTHCCLSFLGHYRRDHDVTCLALLVQLSRRLRVVDVVEAGARLHRRSRRPERHRLLLIEVDDLADLDGRSHLDFAPTDCRRDDEIERVLKLGAQQMADRRNPDGTGWMVLADIEGNRFCIVRSDEERTQTR